MRRAVLLSLVLALAVPGEAAADIIVFPPYQQRTVSRLNESRLICVNLEMIVYQIFMISIRELGSEFFLHRSQFRGGV